jgi:hypothetical protein
LSPRYLTVSGRHWHRVIAEKKIGRKLRRGEVVHHINGNTHDNRPSNLQVCRSMKEHLAIHHATDLRSGKWKKPGASSRFAGVHLCKKTGRWRAMISIDGKSKHLGRFNTERAAYVADKNAANGRATETGD